ncbi:RepB family plasmid replication initiator protein [Salmonella enterica]|nr:RepB family plasmid replication initiator protein [Salmonella enterica]
MTNNKFITDILYADLEKKDKLLTVNSNNTVQPVALMRLGVFIPVGPKSQERMTNIDATFELQKLEIAQSEGYDNIRITGPVLSMDTDFKVWIGVILALSKYGLSTNKITLKFTEFAKMCGYDPKRIDKKLRITIDQSLWRLRNKGISFRKGASDKGYHTGLLKVGGWDTETDKVEIEADEKLWELFAVDYRVLLHLHAIRALPRKETAQALYTFIESLPKSPVPLSFERLRERLGLKTSIGEQNRTIKNALGQLQKINYLDYSITQKDGVNYVLIHKRTPKLKA